MTVNRLFRTAAAVSGIGFLAGALAIAAVNAVEWAMSLGGSSTKNGKGEITGLNFRSTWITDADLKPIAAIHTLKTLDLSHTRITDIGFQDLKNLNSIEDMNLYYAEQIGDGALVVMKNWKRLKHLNLRGTKVTDLGVAQLVNHPALESIDTGYSLFTDNGFEPLTQIPNLKGISVGGNKLTDVGLNLLRLIPNLTSLDLAGSQRTDSGLWFASITDRGLETIGQLRNLRELNLRSSKITDAGIGKLATLANLADLNLGQTTLSATGIEQLVSLTKLEKLSLWKCTRIDDKAVTALSAMKKLKWLDVEGTEITGAGVGSLRTALPDCRIQK